MGCAPRISGKTGGKSACTWTGQNWSIVKAEPVGNNAMILSLEVKGTQGGKVEDQIDASDLWHVTLRIQVCMSETSFVCNCI
jgi:hypothetical protein